MKQIINKIKNIITILESYEEYDHSLDVDPEEVEKFHQGDFKVKPGNIGLIVNKLNNGANIHTFLNKYSLNPRDFLVRVNKAGRYAGIANARNEKLHPETLHWFLTHPDTFKEKISAAALLINPNVPERTLSHPALHANINTPDLKYLHHDIAKHPNISDDLLDSYLNHKDTKLANSALQNPNLPEKYFKKYGSEYNIQQLDALLNNPSVPLGFQYGALTSDHDSHQVMQSLLDSPHTHTEVLFHLLYNSNPKNRLAIAKNIASHPNADPYSLSWMINSVPDLNHYDLTNVIENPNVNHDALEQLSEHPNKIIAKKAKKRLSQLPPQEDDDDDMPPPEDDPGLVDK